MTDRIDDIAYTFWSIHPVSITDDPEMPAGYRGGRRAWYYAKTIRAELDRLGRNGQHLFDTAKSLGWKDDGEGALEFLLRRAREVALEDARRPMHTLDDEPSDTEELGCLCQRCCTERQVANPTNTRLFWSTHNFRYACEVCGNKRCPHHADHRYKCTGSNEPGQVGELI